MARINAFTLINHGINTQCKADYASRSNVQAVHILEIKVSCADRCPPKISQDAKFPLMPEVAIFEQTSPPVPNALLVA